MSNIGRYEPVDDGDAAFKAALDSCASLVGRDVTVEITDFSSDSFVAFIDGTLHPPIIEQPGTDVEVARFAVGNRAAEVALDRVAFLDAQIGTEWLVVRIGDCLISIRLAGSYATPVE